MGDIYVIGIDIGGTNIRIGAKSNTEELVSFIKIPRKEILNGNNSAICLANFIHHYINNELKGKEVEAIAIGFPSILSKDKRTILQTPNIEGLDNLPMVEILEKELGIRVFLERDVNILFYRDMAINSLPKEGIGVGFYIGTGIGNAIFINGEPVIGKDGVAGELGHIPSIGEKKQCSCGNEGCSECYASGWHLVELLNEYFPDTRIDNLFTDHEDDLVLKEYVDAIACVIATEVNILNPDYIVIGGGVIHMKDFPMNFLEDCLYKHVRKPYPARSLQIYYSADAIENGVNGAILYAQNKIHQ